MSLVKNSIYNIIYQLITIITPIITLPYVSRILGETGIGKQAYTNAISQYFILLGVIGLNIYGNRQIAYVRDDKEELEKTFWQLTLLRIITTGLAYLLYIVIFVFFNSKDRTIYFIQSINIIGAMIDISWFFMGIEDFKKIVYRNLITKVIGVVLLFLFVKSSTDVLTYILILSITQLLGQITMWTYIPKLISFRRISYEEVVKHLMPSISLFIPQLAAQVYLLLDKIMLGWFINEAEVGLYDNSQKIIRLTMTIVTSVGTVMIPRMSNIYAKGDLEEFKKMIYEVFSFMNFISIPMAFGLMAITYDFKPWFYGSGFQGIEPLIIINSIIIVFGAWCNILGFQTLIPMKQEREFTISVFAGAIINFLLNLLLIYKYKSLGTSIASVIAEFAVPVVQMYYLRNFINLKVLFNDVKRYLLASIVMCFCVVLLSKGLKPSALSTLLEIGLGGLVYLLILILSKDPNLKKIRKLL
ncbi:oligosaccharide flippase family protein [Desnuesiella massiliensis]|uniref:oligosaccharide flippase family protein n=1 Tax=Desnuesiella massiliensis TaxID=1650662 RepID=UPI0006E283A1|nr:oligosaccharide flippase family protein [Desnuesiella massiliensis]